MKYKSTRVQEYKSAFAPLIGIILGAIIAFALLILVGQAKAENCPHDWHEPPCGPQPTLKQHIKAAAQQNSNLQQELRNYALMFGAVAGFAIRQGEKRAEPVLAAAGIVAAAAQVAKDRQDRIVNDPYDPAFEYAYGGRILSPDDLGMAEYLALWPDNPYLQNIVWFTQVTDFLGDYIGVALDRSASCYLDEWGVSHLCTYWQMERAEAAIQDLGEVFEAMAYNFWYFAYYDLTPLIGDGVNPEFIDLLNNMAGGLYTAAQEYKQ